MSSRLRVGIIVAIVGIILIALGTVTVVRLYRTSLDQATNDIEMPEVVTESVVVARRDLPLGTLLTQDDLEIVNVPVEFTRPETITSMEDAADKILKVDLVAGEMIMSHNLANPTDVTHDIAYVISETHVLMAFPATDLISRESVVQRGDIVDIFATLTTSLEREDAAGEVVTESTSVTFDALQHLDITAMVVDIITDDNAQAGEGAQDENVSRDRIVVQAYLLALDPQNALILKYLKDTGAVFDFVVRAPTSTGQFNLTPITNEYIKELYGLEILP